MMRRLAQLCLLTGALWAGLALAAADTPPGFALSSAHPDATAAGVEILEAGGNAFDAAVAVSAALAVVEPTGSGMGGGGFWLLHLADTGRQVMVDGREEAPSAATATLYQNDAGEVVPQLSRDGALAAAIPGQPAALVHLAKEYGRLPLARSLAPAIRLARDGFPVDGPLLARLAYRFQALAKSPAAARVFLPDGGLPAPDSLIRQPDLADMLERLAREGRDGFYTGEYARRLVDGVRAAGGIWRMEDLARYQVREREPITLELDGLRLVSASPPSSGGVVLSQVMQVLSLTKALSRPPVDRQHLVIEALRTAYRDRAAWLGDPDHVDMPITRLTSAEYAAEIAAEIDLEQARRSADLAPPQQLYADRPNTTHFSIIDAEGNRVAATLSINLSFGSAYMVPGTGILLNDEMDDFSAKPGVPNAYGLVGTQANAVGPGRRPLSSMTPTFVETGDRVAVLGTPGGSRIITMVLLGVLATLDGADAQTIVSAPRYHHQYLPDAVYYEPGAFTAAEQAELEARGFTLRSAGREYGNFHAVLWNTADHQLDAAADPRGIGTAAVRLAPAAESP